MNRNIWLALLITLSLAATGCAQTAQDVVEEQIERETGAEIETDERATAEGLPKELIYPKADVTHRSSIKQEEGNVLSIVFTTSQSTETIEKFFDSEPAANGWEERAKMESNAEDGAPATSYMFSKGDDQAQVIVSKQDEDTIVAVNFYEDVGAE